MAAFEDDASWKAADWKWDAHKLTAAPANTSPTLKGSGGKAARSAPAADIKQGCQVRAGLCKHITVMTGAECCFWPCASRPRGSWILQAHCFPRAWCARLAPARLASVRPLAPSNPPPTARRGPLKRCPVAPSATRLPLQVDGCSTEVGGMRDYHSRYKICEAHLKAPVVHKDGQPLRFCQQVRRRRSAAPAACCRSVAGFLWMPCSSVPAGSRGLAGCLRCNASAWRFSMVGARPPTLPFLPARSPPCPAVCSAASSSPSAISTVRSAPAALAWTSTTHGAGASARWRTCSRPRALSTRNCWLRSMG